MLFNMASILYIQFNLSNTDPKLWSQNSSNKSILILEWLLIEVVGFYMQVISGSVYLAIISCKGMKPISNEQI